MARLPKIIRIAKIIRKTPYNNAKRIKPIIAKESRNGNVIGAMMHARGW
jgi:hypothetical protein